MSRKPKCGKCLFNAYIKERGIPGYIMCAITGKRLTDFGSKRCAVEPKHYKPERK